MADLRVFMAHALRPSGTFAPIGDTWPTVRDPDIGPEFLFAASRGTLGTPPANRIARYDAGYLFARSGWGRARPYASEDYWTLRYGPARIIHGHNDHTSITTFARGRSLIVDNGFSDYTPGAMRDYQRSPAAHSMTIVPTLRYRWDAPTKLVAFASTTRDEVAVVSDEPYAGVQRSRTVFAAHDLPVTLVVDRSVADRSRTFEQLRHIHPDLAPTGSSAYGTRFLSGNRVTALSVTAVPWPGRTRAEVTTVRGQRSPLLGWWSEGSKPVPTPVVRFRSTGVEQRQVALLIPTRAGAKVSWAVAPHGRSQAKVTVTIDGTPMVLRITASGWVVREV